MSLQSLNEFEFRRLGNVASLVRLRQKTRDRCASGVAIITGEIVHIHADEFACQIAEYDDHRRAIEYVRPETQYDDVLHAANYAILVASREFNALRAG